MLSIHRQLIAANSQPDTTKLTYIRLPGIPPSLVMFFLMNELWFGSPSKRPSNMFLRTICSWLQVIATPRWILHHQPSNLEMPNSLAAQTDKHDFQRLVHEFDLCAPHCRGKWNPPTFQHGTHSSRIDFMFLRAHQHQGRKHHAQVVTRFERSMPHEGPQHHPLIISLLCTSSTITQTGSHRPSPNEAGFQAAERELATIWTQDARVVPSGDRPDWIQCTGHLHDSRTADSWPLCPSLCH